MQRRSRRTASPEIARSIQRKTQREKIPREWLSDLDMFARILKRTSNVNKPLRSVLERRSRTENGVKLATVSSTLTLDDFENHPGPSDYKLKVVARKKSRLAIRKQFLSEIELAAEAGAKLVCFNELAYPTPLDAKADAEFQLALQKLVETKSLIVVAASYHDPKGGYNLTRIFAPEKDPLTHAKLTSAAKVGELIRTPSGRRLRYYKTRLGTVGILVCLDAYEPSLFLRLMQKNSEFTDEEEIDLILVPSFSPQNSAALVESCQDLSYATSAVVVFVNCSNINPRHAVFVAGEKMPFRTSKKLGYVRKPLSETVVLHSITTRSVEHLQEKARDSYSVLLKYLLDTDRKFRSEIIY